MRKGLYLLGLCAAACGDDVPDLQLEATTSAGAHSTSEGTSVATTGGADDGSGDDSGSTDDGPPGPPTVWVPGVVLPSDDTPHPRGLLDRRGLMHTHSPLSHDACDGEPMDAKGNLDAQCVQDFRRALCQIQHDFVMTTDHRESFSDTDYPAVFHYDPARGDTLLERDGLPVASWAGCEGEAAPDVAPTLLLAGCEAAIMPVGLPQHAPERGETYGSAAPEAITELQQLGGVVLVSHTEDWEVQDLVDLPLDGFELYNLHANLFQNLGAGLLLLDALNNDPESLPHSDLVIMPLWLESPIYMERWGGVLAQGVRRVATAGTDAHRNTFPELLPDGERLDSFRRMMQWFSNHLLVTGDGKGNFDDRDLVDALRGGRAYAAFEYMGYPGGFDTTMRTADEVAEIGGEAALSAAPEIVVVAPTVRLLDPDATPPEITLHVLRAIDTGFEEVASGAGELSYAPDTAGAYRVEVRIVPHHLEAYLGSYTALASEVRAWIYANPFYVTQ